MSAADEDAGRVAALERELAAARRTVEALTARVEAIDGDPPEEAGALARALAGVQRELARRTASLEETEATYRALYESTPDPLLTVDSGGFVVACNRTALEWLAVDRDSLVGAPLSRFLDAPDAGELDALVARGWRGAAERRFTLRDGRRVSFNASPIVGARQGAHHVTVRDVTTREALEGVADERRRMEALSDLAGGLARELNDPMSIVQGRLELLLELGGSRPDALERHLSVALTHARRVSAALQNLRLVGHTSLTHLERVFVLDAWEAARVQMGPRLDGLDLRVNVEPDDLAVGGAEALYARVLANLVDRIIDFCGRDGQLVISAREEEGSVVIRLLGGARAVRTTELVPPPRVDEGQLDDGALGIALAKTVVRSVGGHVEARSAGRRAMYALTLPPAPQVRAHPRPVDSRILVVGSATFGEGVRELLAREGFAVEVSPDAESALEALLGGSAVEGVVAALALPGASGSALLQEVARARSDLLGRLVLVSDSAVVSSPGVQVVGAPLRREQLLRALGRKVRAKR